MASNRTRRRLRWLGGGALAASVLALAWLLLHWPEWPARMPIAAQRWLAVALPEPAWPQLPTGDFLSRVRQRGTLVVAVREYQRPAPPSAPTPAEPDGFDAQLARFIAQKLGVSVKLVGLKPAASGTGYAPPTEPVDLVLGSTQPEVGAPRETTWTDKLPFIGAAHASQGPSRSLPTAYTGGAARLVVLRHSALHTAADLRGRSVCVQRGSGHAPALVQDQGVVLRNYPSGVHAIYAFMGGECDALAEDEALVERLMAREEWRFYRTLPLRITPGDLPPQITLTEADSASTEFVERVVRYWKIGGALLAAREQRVGDVSFELIQLEDGLVCHAS